MGKPVTGNVQDSVQFSGLVFNCTKRPAGWQGALCIYLIFEKQCWPHLLLVLCDSFAITAQEAMKSTKENSPLL